MKSTTDIWFIAYLRLVGEKVQKSEAFAHGKVRCYFSITEDDWSKFRLEFQDSKFYEYKKYIEQTKDLAF